ncbi:hypothetical protein [Demequina sp. NBRC 110051]|uniref:hypothetical protein n=1 Tax=Demequina sp. NBRC 110051 TaxID=1570340 RepID=UPI00135668ED|nr:hypothetical protein [Demequina sp. NBRC 110051]
MDLRKAAIPAAILLGGSFLAACGDTTAEDPSAPSEEMESTMDPGMESTMEPTG